MPNLTPGVMLSSELAPKELIALAQLAESVGCQELWYTDQRFWRDCYAGLSLIAQHTERILIGPGVSDPFTRHPATIAMAIATIDELSGGRAQLGLGVGGSGIAQMKLPKERPVRALQEAIELIDLMLLRDVVRYEGEIFSLIDGRLGFEPPRRHIPIYVATHSPQTLRLSGRLADGVILGNMGRREAIDQAVSVVRDGEQRAGRDAGSVVIDLRLEAIISDDREGAFAVMRKRMANRLIFSYPNWDFLGDQRHELHPETTAAAEAHDAARLQQLLTDDDVRSTALVGNAEETARQLAGLLTNDIGKVTIRPYGFGDQKQDETIRLFAQAVWPKALAQRDAVVSV